MRPSPASDPHRRMRSRPVPATCRPRIPSSRTKAGRDEIKPAVEERPAEEGQWMYSAALFWWLRCLVSSHTVVRPLRYPPPYLSMTAGGTVPGIRKGAWTVSSGGLTVGLVLLKLKSRFAWICEGGIMCRYEWRPDVRIEEVATYRVRLRIGCTTEYPCAGATFVVLRLLSSLEHASPHRVVPIRDWRTCYV